MSCNVDRRILSWTLIGTSSTTVVFYPAGGWESASGITAVKGWGEMRGRNGNIVATPAIQLTNNINNLASATTVAAGTQINADGVTDPDDDHAVDSGAYRYARVGWNVALSTGGTLATAFIGGVVDIIRS